MIVCADEQKLRRKPKAKQKQFGHNYCHHCNKLTITDDLISCSKLSCSLLFCSKCLHRYDIRVTDDFKSRPCLVCQERCLCTSCTQASIQQDLNLMNMLVKQDDETKKTTCKILNEKLTPSKSKRRHNKAKAKALELPESGSNTTIHEGKRDEDFIPQDVSRRYNMDFAQTIIKQQSDEAFYKCCKIIDLETNDDHQNTHGDSHSLDTVMQNQTENFKNEAPFVESPVKEQVYNSKSQPSDHAIEIGDIGEGHLNIQEELGQTTPGIDSSKTKQLKHEVDKMCQEPTRRSTRSKHLTINGNNFCNILAQNTGSLYVDENLSLEKCLYKDENEYFMFIMESRSRKSSHKKKPKRAK